MVRKDDLRGAKHFFVVEVTAWRVIRKFSKEPFFQGLLIFCMKAKPKILIPSFHIQMI